MEIVPQGFVLSHNGVQNRVWLLKLARLVLSERAEGWMSSSVIPIFGGAVPNDLAETLEGAKEVETVLQQLRFGMF